MPETQKEKSLKQIKKEAAEVAVDIENLRKDLTDFSVQIQSFYEETQAADVPRLTLALADARSRVSAAMDAADEARSVIPVEGQGDTADG